MLLKNAPLNPMKQDITHFHITLKRPLIFISACTEGPRGELVSVLALVNSDT